MPDDFFRARFEQMIDLQHPLAVLRIPWGQLEVALAPSFERRDRASRVVVMDGLFGLTLKTIGLGARESAANAFQATRSGKRVALL